MSSPRSCRSATQGRWPARRDDAEGPGGGPACWPARGCWSATPGPLVRAIQLYRGTPATAGVSGSAAFQSAPGSTSRASAVDAADSLISQIVGEVASARGRRGSLEPESVESTAEPEPMKAELEVLDRRQDLLELRKGELTLRAPSDGEVA